MSLGARGRAGARGRHDGGVTKKRRLSSGFVVIAVASAVGGTIGYGITIVAARALGVDYGAFGVFWSALYFVVGALAGAQQEFARITRSRRPLAVAHSVARARHQLLKAIGAATVASVFLSGLATPALAATALRAAPPEHALAIAVAFAFFGLNAVLLGMQYGARRWRTVAFATVADPLMRIIFISVAVGAGGGLTGGIWATVLPFPVLTAILLIMTIRDRSLYLEEDAIPAVRAAAVVVAGGVASSFMINGIPMLFALVAPSEDPEVVSRYVFAFILIRAPLVVGALALQSFLIVVLRDHPRAGRLTASLVCAIVPVTALGAISIAAFGEPLVLAVGKVVGAPTQAILVGIVVASGTASALIVVGCWALASERRQAYTAGWWAAAVSIVVLSAVIPGDSELRITVASAAAPVLGMIAMMIGARVPK